MAQLHELRIREAVAGAHTREFDLELTVIDPHPPMFSVSGGELATSSSRELIATDSLVVPADELASWMPGVLPPSLFDLTQAEIFGKLLSGASPARPFESFDWAAGRVVIESDQPATSMLPWEDLIVSGLDRLTVVRQMLTTAGERRRYLDSRIDFAITTVGTTGPQPTPNQLFDYFTMQIADEHQALRWDAQPADSDLWHIAAARAAEAEDAVAGVPCPRVVVAQLAVAPERAVAVDRLARAALDQGAWAVLIAEVPDPGSQFFGWFYRKLFHNWPLEWCMWAAREVSGRPPAAIRLYVRPGGETALSLNRIPAELALALAGDIAARGERATPFRDHAPQFPQEPPLLDLRQRRVVRHIRKGIEGTSSTRSLEQAEESIEVGNNLRFDEENHDYGMLATAARRVRDEALGAADELETLGAEIERSLPGPRHTNISFLDKSDVVLAPEAPLRPRAKAILRVAIEPTPGEAQVSVVFDESPLVEAFRENAIVELDVVVFAPDTEFVVKDNIKPLRLPRVGASEPVNFEVTPRHAGWCALRVALYYRNTMLQSVAVRAFVSKSNAPPEAIPTVQRDLDWVATTDLQLLDDLAAPVFNIFSNQGPGGSHWIGVFSDDGAGGMPLRSGQMRTLDNLVLTNRTRELRQTMQDVHGDPAYLYPADKPPADPEVVKFGRHAIIELAKIGLRTYDYLFDSAEDLPDDRLDAFADAISAPGIVSVARCDSTWAIPWAALYDKYLDVGRDQEITLCSVFESQLMANQWEDGMVAAPQDLLDDPAACRAQSACPLNDNDKRKVTVCPFGFWGIRHQIEQPLQQVEPTADDVTPVELTTDEFNQASLILRNAAEDVRVAAGAFPFVRVDKHKDDLAAIGNLALQWESDRQAVMDLLYAGAGHHLVYFFCHGVEDGAAFALQVGPEGGPQNTISAESIERSSVHWGKAGNPQPLVVVIACESLATRPEIAHALFGKLKRVNASGVIGSEISMAIRLGREAGLLLIQAIAGGASVGDAFLDMRRHCLRQFNPLGLALTANAPATLHLCDDPEGAGTCSRYHLRRRAP